MLESMEYIQRLLEEESTEEESKVTRLSDEQINMIARGIVNTGLGYWFTEERVDEDGDLILEFISVNGPKIEIKIIGQESL